MKLTGAEKKARLMEPAVEGLLIWEKPTKSRTQVWSKSMHDFAYSFDGVVYPPALFHSFVAFAWAYVQEDVKLGRNYRGEGYNA